MFVNNLLASAADLLKQTRDKMMKKSPLRQHKLVLAKLLRKFIYPSTDSHWLFAFISITILLVEFAKAEKC